MIKYLFCLFIPFSLMATSPEVAKCGKLIWKNECAGSVEGLTSWNKGEAFASIGIGHFIWYPKGYQGPYTETFPQLVRYLKQHGAHVPDWLLGACPWNTREEFYAQFEENEMKQLRSLLASTVDLQAEYIVMRFDGLLTKITESLTFDQKKQVAQLQGSAKGYFALIDYVNFKGEGLSPKERYQGQGWGLLQVLQNMPQTRSDPLKDFVTSAKNVLRKRVENAPPERNEQRWLTGWENRLESYL